MDHSWDINGITTNKKLKEYVEQNKSTFTKYDWYLVSKNTAINEDLVREYKDYLDWDWLSMSMKMSDSFMEEFFSYLDIYAVCGFQKISERFFISHQNELHLPRLSENHNIQGELKYRIINTYDSEKHLEDNVNYWNYLKNKNSLFKNKNKTTIIPDVKEVRYTNTDKMKVPQLREILESRGVNLMAYESKENLKRLVKLSDEGVDVNASNE